MSKDLPEGLAFKEDLNLYRYCNGNLNFSTVSHDDEDFGYQKKKIMRDPMSHRIIEKRRRDRMNNCLADLSRLIPPDYLKKGRGRIEKTEIIEMAIKHMRHLQSVISSRNNEGQCENLVGSQPDMGASREYGMTPIHHPIVAEHYRLGYLECLSEAMHFLVEVQGYFAGDSLCVQMINHLHKHCDKILKSDLLNHPRKRSGETASSSSSTSPPNPNYSNNSPPLGLSASNGSNSDDNQGNPPYENVRSFDSIEDPLRSMNFRSPRRHSDVSSRDSKKNCDGYYHRYPEPENERTSENPSDSDMEQGYSVGGRSKDSRNYVNDYEDASKCRGIDCLPRNYSSSSGIGSNLEYPSPYEELMVKEENGSSQLRNMLTSPKVIQLDHASGTIRMPDIKSIKSPIEFDASLNPPRMEIDQYQTDALNYKTQNASVDAEDATQQEISSNFESSAGDTHSNMYKFKNNIKQRFSKEKRNHGTDEDTREKKAKLSEAPVNSHFQLNHESDGSKYGSDPLLKERLNLLNKREDDSENMDHNRFCESEMDHVSNRLSFGHKSATKIKKWEENVKFSKVNVPPFLSPEVPMEYKSSENGRKHLGLLTIAEYLPEESHGHKYSLMENEGTAGIPIFALHSKGSFYIPLTLEHTVLAPFLPLLGLTKTEEVEEKPVLHPVTISVNFQAPFFSRNPKPNSIPWK